MNQNNSSTSIDISFLRRMGYGFNEDETECRVNCQNGHARNFTCTLCPPWRPVKEVIDDYVDFWHNSDQDVKNPTIYKGL